MTTATAQAAMEPSVVQLSAPSEDRLMFWMSPPDAQHTPRVVAAVLNVSEGHLQHWRTTELGPAYTKRGKLIYYTGAAVRAWINGNGT